MALNIKDPTTNALVRELSALTGENLTEAIRIAVSERLAQLRRRAAVSGRATELQRFIDRGRQRATLDDHTPEEIIGYDENGLPA
ncbi:MAG: type II toxin-antitoxin system VapB family antitoxin [Propionibacteriaceae bacterium]|nr:type II toxin-antitoxin system VapB family antitoxin [Propionibacteriaceae bacterium]